ncbi:alpha/beta fold hydrolase [Salinicoccus albus]|uniref:alpha/beta fold hydrolase n=1 Tax=Salinicoccus albus TaxID=418756 RepID=UPI0003747D89|nr:alpha/beta hydrolase [Salinicoccus albus]
MKIYEEFIRNEDRQIAVKVFMPEKPVCAVQILHGMAEHMERYSEMMAWFAMNDCMVVMHNHRGHGADAETPGHFEDFNLLITDALAVSSIIPGDCRKFILGHSMGSIAARRLLETNVYDGGIIVGTGNKDTVADFISAKAMASIAKAAPAKKSKTINKLAFLGYDSSFKGNHSNRWLCSDDTVVNNYNRDPHCGFLMSNRALYEILRHIGQAQKQQNLKSIASHLPILLIGGKEDPFSNNGRDLRRLAKTFIRYTDSVTVQLYEDSRHEVLFEKNREQVYSRLLEWVMKHV